MKPKKHCKTEKKNKKKVQVVTWGSGMFDVAVVEIYYVIGTNNKTISTAILFDRIRTINTLLYMFSAVHGGQITSML